LEGKQARTSYPHYTQDRIITLSRKHVTGPGARFKDKDGRRVTPSNHDLSKVEGLFEVVSSHSILLYKEVEDFFHRLLARKNDEINGGTFKLVWRCFLT
jgi:hypothetical protein